MKILVNACALRTAGARTVAINFLSALSKMSHVEAVAYVPRNCGYSDIVGKNLVIRELPSVLDRRSVTAPVVDSWWLPRQIAKVAPDIVLSMGNIGIPTTVPQVVYMHWPYAWHPSGPVWDLMDRFSWFNRKLRLVMVKNAFRNADAFIFQTETARGRFQELYGSETPAFLVPNAVSLNSTSRGDKGSISFPGLKADHLKLLCLSRYYPHKNLEVLLSVAELLRKRGSKIQILLTIDETQHPKSKALLHEIGKRSLQNILVNLGPIPLEDVPQLYSVSNGVILPTLLESFSGVFVEALHYGVPLLTSDLDFAREVCGPAAFYFDPHDPQSIVASIDEAFSNPTALSEVVVNGQKRVAAMPSWNDVTESIVDVLYKVAKIPASPTKPAGLRDRPAA